MSYKTNKLETVPAYRASDGHVMVDGSEAARYQRTIDFSEWYYGDDFDNSLFSGTSRASIKDLIEWLERNKFEVLQFLDAND